MRVNGILSFLSFCDVCSDDCRSNVDQTTRSRQIQCSRMLLVMGSCHNPVCI